MQRESSHPFLKGAGITCSARSSVGGAWLYPSLKLQMLASWWQPGCSNPRRTHTHSHSYSGSPVKLEILYPFVGGGLCLDKSVAVPKHGRDA